MFEEKLPARAWKKETYVPRGLAPSLSSGGSIYAVLRKSCILSAILCIGFQGLFSLVIVIGV